MKVTVFGANGKVGQLLISSLLKDGHEVVAFIHKKNNLPKNPKLKIVKGDIYNKEDVEKALRDSQAVLSALASWGTPRKDVLSAAMKKIIPAMQKTGIKKIVSLTG